MLSSVSSGDACRSKAFTIRTSLKPILVSNTHRAETMEQLEKLLPYNIDPQLLNDMRGIPDLIVPEKSGVN